MINQNWTDRAVMDNVSVGDVITGLARIGLVVVIAVVAVRLARRAIPRALGKVGGVAVRDARWEQRVQTLSGTLIGLIGVLVWSLAFVTALGELGIPLGPLLASAGVAGLAVGFGAQQLVRDVISGFFILVEDQFGVGDRVTLGGVTGHVETMSLRLTRVRGEDGVLHHLRNGDLGVVSNASRGYAVATVQVPLPSGMERAEGLRRLVGGMARLVESGVVDDALLADPQVLGVTELRGDSPGIPVASVTARSTPEGKARVTRELLQAALTALSGEEQPPPAPKPVAASPGDDAGPGDGDGPTEPVKRAIKRVRKATAAAKPAERARRARGG